MKQNKVFNIKIHEEMIPPVISLIGSITGDHEEHILQVFQNVVQNTQDHESSVSDNSSSKTILIDFHETDYINSSGIGILIAMITTITEVNGQIFFVNLPPHIQRIMDMVGLTEYISIDYTKELKNLLSS